MPTSDWSQFARTSLEGNARQSSDRLPTHTNVAASPAEPELELDICSREVLPIVAPNTPSTTDVADLPQQVWARPASDLAAKRLADQRRRVSDFFDDAARVERHVAPRPDAALPAVIPESLQATVLPPAEPAWPRAFILNHLAGVALALSLVVNVVTAVTTVRVTSNGQEPSSHAAPTSEHDVATQAAAGDAAQQVLQLQSRAYLAGNAARQALRMELGAPHVANELSWTLLSDLTPAPLLRATVTPLSSWDQNPDGCRCPTVTQLQTDAHAQP